ncbi:sialin-like [Drosophila ananassae]|uniref:sialin-like n=1 Tax=Drosophila ananassae TaxID=7217 RepID=UPI0013A5DAB8|nr:sialin-like [Drosophila ananassae]
MTISLGFNGAGTASNLANSQDLALNYAGTLYGIINCIGTTPGIFSPLIVAAFTKEENTIDQWHFIIGSSSLELLSTYCPPIFSGSLALAKSRSGTKWRPQSRERILSTQSCSLCPGSHL